MWPGWFKGSYTEVPGQSFRLNNADAVLAVFAHKKLIGVSTTHSTKVRGIA